MAPRATAAALRKLQVACRGCHVCVDAGIIPEANPTFSGGWGAPFFLVGQAPGPAERESRRPFSGRAGKELARWMLRGGGQLRALARRRARSAQAARPHPCRADGDRALSRPRPVGVESWPDVWQE